MLRRRMMMAKAQEVEEMKEWRLIAKEQYRKERAVLILLQMMMENHFRAVN